MEKNTEHKHTRPEPVPELPSAFSLFRPSYNALLVNIWTFLGLLGIPIILVLLAGVLANISKSGHSVSGILNVLSLILALSAMTFALVATPSTPFVQMQSAKGEAVSIGKALRIGLKYFLKFWGITILVGLIILGGFLLFIIPGLFMLRRYILAPYYMYDKNVGVMDALRRSAKDSKKFSLSIWGLIGVTLLIGLPSFMSFLIYLSIVLQIIYYCAPAIRYLQIQKAKRHQDFLNISI